MIEFKDYNKRKIDSKDHDFFDKLERSVEPVNHHSPEVRKMLEETKDLTSYVDFLS